MHEPDQRAAFAERAAATAPDGVLLLQYHELSAIVDGGQWNALRHGHFAYYSMVALQNLLAGAGLQPHGGLAVPALRRHRAGGCGAPRFVARWDAGPEIGRLDAADAALARPEGLTPLQAAADRHANALRSYLQAHARRRPAGCSPTARLASRGAIRTRRARLRALARGRRRVTGQAGPHARDRHPDHLARRAGRRRADVVLLTLADLLPEVSARLPELAGRWVTDESVAMASTGGGRP